MLGLDQYMDVAPANLDFNADALLKRNVGVATANAGEFSYNPAELKVEKKENGRMSVVIPANTNQAEWWKDLEKLPDPSYGKKLWEVLNQGGMVKAGQMHQETVVDVNGNQHLVQLRSDGKVSTQQLAPEASLGVTQAKKAQGLVDSIWSDIQTSTDLLTRSAAAAAAKDKAVVVASAAANSTLNGIASAQIQANTDAANAVIAGGEAQAVRVENLSKAIASVDASGLMNKIFNTNLERQVKIDAQLNKAQDRVLELTTNPFFVAGTALHGGPDKDPLLQGAVQTVKQLQDAKQASAVTTNNLLNGVFDMQKITRGTFEVATPAEVRAEAATKAQKFKDEAAKIAAGQATIPVNQATLEAKVEQEDFKNQKDILQKSITEKTQLLNAANGVERIALQAQIAEMNARLRKYTTDENNAVKREKMNDVGRSVGMSAAVTSVVAKRYASMVLNNPNPSEDEVAAEFVAGLKSNKPLIDMFAKWDSGVRTQGGAFQKWQEMTTVAQSLPGVTVAYPEVAGAVTPGENGYKRWSLINQTYRNALSTAVAGSKGGDKAQKQIEQEVAENFQAALTASQADPEGPFKVAINGKATPVATPGGSDAVSPWMVHPGTFLTTSGANNFSGLTDAMKAELKANPLAQLIAETQGVYEKAGKSVSFKDVLVATTELKKKQPDLSVEQVSRMVADVYQAGTYLNNKYLNPKFFGLPEQKDYPVEIVRETGGAAFMRIAGEALRGTADAALQLPPSVYTTPAEATAQEFRKGFTSRFGGLDEKTKFSLTNAAEVAAVLKRSYPELWNKTKQDPVDTSVHTPAM